MAYTFDDFPWRSYVAEHPYLIKGDTSKEYEGKRAYDDYIKSGSKWGEKTPTPVSLDTSNTPIGDNPTAQVVAGNTGTNQVNVADYAGQVVTDPSKLLNGNKTLSDKVPLVDPNTPGTTIDKNDPKYQMDPSATNVQGNTADTATGVATTAKSVDPKQAATYTPALTADEVAKQDMTGAKGTLSEGSKVQAQQIDENATANGQNGLGKALNNYANQNISNVIDTSSSAGKALAQALGEGNYTDSKATVKGQLDILAKEFVGPDGEAKIPTWATGTARNVSKIAAFSGMSGTAATAAMASAIMEASLPIAQQDAQLFSTITLQNLSNKQASVINKANVLSNISLANLDARTNAAIENSKNFMQMDLANLSNEQQASVINTQDRVQSILEDAKSVNAQRLFTSQSQNEMNQFYDNLNSTIATFNASQVNSMSQFNTSEVNKTSQFNAEQLNQIAEFNSQLEDSRQKFYTNMQYQIDTANANWRQNVTLTNNKNTFDAASVDVQNAVNVSVEQLNQLWDRSDALLDYVFKHSENEEDRSTNLMLGKISSSTSIYNTRETLSAQKKAKKSSGFGGILGSIAGSIFGPVGSSLGSSLGKSLFG